MRLANHAGRATIVRATGGIDVGDASGGRFGPDIGDIYAHWDDFATFAADLPDDAPLRVIDPARLGSPVPRPPQVFAVGLNYRDHAQETGMTPPEIPAVFTKFPASLAGPFDDVLLSGTTVDWEVELVVVIAHRVDFVAEEDAWAHVAGVSVGQDISDRTTQFAAGAQFSLGKSYRGYGPIGPWLVSPDELADRDALPLRCSINGQIVQDANTAEMIFSVGALISRIAEICPLLPGDVIFTGTPAGCGVAAKPPRFLAPDDSLESTIEGVGTIRNVMRAADQTGRG
ncbi:MAG: fumarylacetoacetate hydrolase family protein [Mycobacterium sp.]